MKLLMLFAAGVSFACASSKAVRSQAAAPDVASVQAKIEAESILVNRRFTDIWQNAGERWVLIARQATHVGIDGAVYGHPDPILNR